MPDAYNINFKFEVIGKTELDLKWFLLKQIPRDFTPLWNLLRSMFWEYQRYTFEAGGGYDNKNPWLPVTQRHLKWKLLKGYPSTPLICNGSLMDSWTGGRGAVSEVTTQSLTIQSDKRTPDGKWNLSLLHQAGTRFLPKRPILSFGPGGKKKFAKAISKFLKSKIEDAAKAR